MPGSVDVHPIPQFGAVESGTHRFYELARGAGASPVGIAKYIHVCQQTEAGWKLARVITYDHTAAPLGAIRTRLPTGPVIVRPAHRGRGSARSRPHSSSRRARPAL